MKFSRDGALFITAALDGIRFWRVANGALVAYFDIETTKVQSLDVSRDNRYFAYGRDDGVLVLARMPLYMSEISRSDDQLILRWQGGTGRYQLQHREDLTGGELQNVSEPTTDTSFTATVSGRTVFYRVQSLPTP